MRPQKSVAGWEIYPPPPSPRDSFIIGINLETHSCIYTYTRWQVLCTPNYCADALKVSTRENFVLVCVCLILRSLRVRSARSLTSSCPHRRRHRNGIIIISGADERERASFSKAFLTWFYDPASPPRRTYRLPSYTRTVRRRNVPAAVCIVYYILCTYTV